MNRDWKMCTPSLELCGIILEFIIDNAPLSIVFCLEMKVEVEVGVYFFFIFFIIFIMILKQEEVAPKRYNLCSPRWTPVS